MIKTGPHCYILSTKLCGTVMQRNVANSQLVYAACSYINIACMNFQTYTHVHTHTFTHHTHTHTHTHTSLQRLGSVADALAAAYAVVRPEVQSEALPPKVRIFYALLGEGTHSII